MIRAFIIIFLINSIQTTKLIDLIENARRDDSVSYLLETGSYKKINESVEEIKKEFDKNHIEHKEITELFNYTRKFHFKFCIVVERLVNIVSTVIILLLIAYIINSFKEEKTNAVVDNFLDITDNCTKLAILGDNSCADKNTIEAIKELYIINSTLTGKINKIYLNNTDLIPEECSDKLSKNRTLTMQISPSVTLVSAGEKNAIAGLCFSDPCDGLNYNINDISNIKGILCNVLGHANYGKYCGGECLHVNTTLDALNIHTVDDFKTYADSNYMNVFIEATGKNDNCASIGVNGWCEYQGVFTSSIPYLPEHCFIHYENNVLVYSIRNSAVIDESNYPDYTVNTVDGMSTYYLYANYAESLGNYFKYVAIKTKTFGTPTEDQLVKYANTFDFILNKTAFNKILDTTCTVRNSTIFCLVNKEIVSTIPTVPTTTTTTTMPTPSTPSTTAAPKCSDNPCLYAVSDSQDKRGAQCTSGVNNGNRCSVCGCADEFLSTRSITDKSSLITYIKSIASITDFTIDDYGTTKFNSVDFYNCPVYCYGTSANGVFTMLIDREATPRESLIANITNNYVLDYNDQSTNDDSFASIVLVSQMIYDLRNMYNEVSVYQDENILFIKKENSFVHNITEYNSQKHNLLYGDRVDAKFKHAFIQSASDPSNTEPCSGNSCYYKLVNIKNYCYEDVCNSASYYVDDIRGLECTVGMNSGKHCSICSKVNIDVITRNITNKTELVSYVRMNSNIEVAKPGNYTKVTLNSALHTLPIYCMLSTGLNFYTYHTGIAYSPNIVSITNSFTKDLSDYAINDDSYLIVIYSAQMMYDFQYVGESFDPPVGLVHYEYYGEKRYVTIQNHIITSNQSTVESLEDLHNPNTIASTFFNFTVYTNSSTSSEDQNSGIICPKDAECYYKLAN